MTPTYEQARRLLTLAPMAIVLALLLTSCPGDEVSEDDCACPNLKAAAESIDWIGDGTAPNEADTDLATGQFSRRASLVYQTPDRAGVQQQVEDRLRSAGFVVVDETPFSATFAMGEWSVHVKTTGTEDDPKVAVFVQIVDDDARAAEILSPVSEALGTLP